MSFALYLITDPESDVVAITRAALEAVPLGVAAVMVRDPRAGARALATLARALHPICRARRAPLLINDRADVALAVDADGVHLPERGLDPVEARALLGPRALIGASRHGAPSAGRGTPDFVTISPVGNVPGKGPPIGVEGLRAAVAAWPVPVYALGGIDATQAPALMSAGAKGIAVIRALYRAREPAAAAASLWSAIRSSSRPDG